MGGEFRPWSEETEVLRRVWVWVCVDNGEVRREL